MMVLFVAYVKDFGEDRLGSRAGSLKIDYAEHFFRAAARELEQPSKAFI